MQKQYMLILENWRDVHKSNKESTSSYNPEMVTGNIFQFGVRMRLRPPGPCVSEPSASTLGLALLRPWWFTGSKGVSQPDPKAE